MWVLHPKASGSNNGVERSLRDAAQDQRTSRTSKTLRGAKRRTILVRVLESLKLHLSELTLASVQTEIQDWWQRGEILFARLLKECGLDPPLRITTQQPRPHQGTPVRFRSTNATPLLRELRSVHFLLAGME